MKKFIFLSILVCALSACDRRQPERPAERAGRDIDNAADTVTPKKSAATSAQESARTSKALIQTASIKCCGSKASGKPRLRPHILALPFNNN